LYIPQNIFSQDQLFYNQTQNHILKWGWRVNEKGWVNYPDYQQRIFKNIDRIKWVNKVHERIVGARTTEPFPDGFNLNLIHLSIELTN
jgi:hypothetical protein